MNKTLMVRTPLLLLGLGMLSTPLWSTALAKASTPESAVTENGEIGVAETMEFSSNSPLHLADLTPIEPDRAGAEALALPSSPISAPSNTPLKPKDTPVVESADAVSTSVDTASAPGIASSGFQTNPEASPSPIPSTEGHAPSPNHPSTPTVTTPTVAQGYVDPADGSAPPGLNVMPGNQPISPYLAIAMRQELESLVGRVESALLLANSLDQPNEVRVATGDAVLTASSADVPVNHAPPATLHPVLVEAQQLLRDWPTLMQQREYAIARQRWLQVRQALWANFPVDRPYAQAEIRAVWLDRGTIVQARSKQGLAVVFDRLATAGINTVFLETINAGYPIYPSRVSPQQNPLTRGWDPLQAAVELAHERNMELHAWMWTFAAGNQRHNAVLNLPADYPGPVLELHPDWAATDNQGNLIPVGQTKPFYDPANPEVRNYLYQLVNEIVSNYDIDGIQFDYIRYPFQDPSANRTYGYGLSGRQQFMSMTGVDPITLSPRDNPAATETQRREQRYLWDRWTQFRIDQVTTFVRDASTLARRRRPGIVVSTAVFPLPENERLQKLQQDWGTWAREGYVDWVVLMSYAEDTNRLEQLVYPWLVDSDFGSTLIIPGIRILSLTEPAVIDQIQSLRDLPSSGYALFAAANLNSSLQTIFSNTQGSASGNNTQPLPQQQPYQAASDRYQALQREWNWLIEHGQLWMDARSLNRWVTEANLVGKALTDLAANPSTRRLNQARSRLTNFQTQLGAGMVLQMANAPYRLETWHHHLTTIDNLLDYGEARRNP